MPFRKALIWIKKQYLENPMRLFLYSGAAAALLIGISFLLDIILPWNQLAIFVRSLFALPLAVALFVVSYAGVIAYVEKKKADATEEPFLTWRERLSPTMRTRVAFIIGAVLFVFMFAAAEGPGYTMVAGIIVASVVGLLTFVRKTSEELRRATIGLPDTRDAVFEAHMRERARAATQSKRAKELEEQREKDRLAALKEEERLEK